VWTEGWRWETVSHIGLKIQWQSLDFEKFWAHHDLVMLSYRTLPLVVTTTLALIGSLVIMLWGERYPPLGSCFLQTMKSNPHIHALILFRNDQWSSAGHHVKLRWTTVSENQRRQGFYPCNCAGDVLIWRLEDFAGVTILSESIKSGEGKKTKWFIWMVPMQFSGDNFPAAR